MRVLLVEDNPGDARLIRVYLAEAGMAGFELAHADRLAEGIRQVGETEFDVVLLDLSLPDASGLETITKMHEAAPARPIIVLTGLNDEAVALEAVRRGAQDYLIKGQINSALLVRAMHYAIERKRVLIELQQLNEVKNQLLGMAAHDLRNPLSVIQTASSFLLDESGKLLPEETRIDFLRRMKGSSEFMLKLIDDLLDVAKIESGKLDLDLSDVDMAGIIDDNLVLNGMLAEKKNIRLNFSRGAELPKLRADQGKVEQVLNNLISNALKFSLPDTEVKVTAQQMNGSVVVSVEDHGLGIPAGELDKLFKPFGRTSVRSTAGEKSTGLGLAISRKIIERHGGRIWASSEVGKGSTFSFALPIGSEPSQN
jgi:signal transduction histidine kinase